MNLIIDADWKFGGFQRDNKIGRNIDIDSGNWFDYLTIGKTIVYDLEALQHFGNKPITCRKNIVFCGFKDIPKEAKENCDYYSFMTRMHKHDDSFLTAFKVRPFTNLETSTNKATTTLITVNKVDDIPDVANFITSSDFNIFICGGVALYEKFLPLCDKVYICVHDYTIRDEDKVECPFHIIRNRDWEEDRIYAQGYDKEGRHYEVILFNRRKDE